MLCPCDNITGYLNGLQYLQNPVYLVYPGKFKLKLWCSVLVTTSLVTLMVSSISLGYLPGLPPEHFSLLSLSLMLSHCSLHLRPPCSYAILALTLSLLLHYPCSYAILALTPSLLLGHPCSNAILALRPSLLLPHLCSYAILALTPSLLLRHPCSYAILALTPSLLLRHPRSYAILALTPSSLLQHPCSHAILALTTSLLFDILAPNPHFLSSHLFSLLSLPTCSVSFLFLICLRQLPLINLNNLWSLSRCLSCGYIIDPYIVDLSLR